MTDSRIFFRGSAVGSGFLLDGRTVVTAAHVVREKDVADLVVMAADGQAGVSRKQVAPEVDAAVLTLARPLHAEAVRLTFSVKPRASWQVTGGAHPNAAYLSGEVTASSRKLINEQRHSMPVLQLKVDQDLGRFHGYSGSAVTVDGGAIVGMLSEQVLEDSKVGAERVTRATNVLYAVPVESIVERFGLSVPGGPVGGDWRDALRLLCDELAEDPDLPAELSSSAHIAVQMYGILAEALAAVGAEDPGRLAEHVRRLWRRTAEQEPLYRLAINTPLTVAALHSQLDRLAQVHAIVATQPAHRRRPRYRIAAPTCTLDDVGNAIEQWRAARLAVAGEERDSRDILLRDMLARLEAPVLYGDPSGELIAQLHDAGCHDPTRTAATLVRAVFDAGPASEELESLLERSISRGTPGQVTLLTAAHRQRRNALRHDGDGGYLVNRQPQLYHLENGFLAATDELDDVEREYWSWYEKEVAPRAEAGERSVPMFWIIGPSGAGKSVLLLQLLGRLNARSGVSALLPNDGARLSQVSGWAAGLSRVRHTVVGVDDPLSWTEDDERPAWPDVFGALGRLRQTAPIFEFPVFVCCAPTEHLAEFQDKYGSDGLLIGSHVLDPYRPEFTRQLRAWFEQRTGAPPPPIPQRGIPMPAQLFLEWLSGETIEEYAQRFRRRIEAQGLPELPEFFTRLLAVNRLYVGYPEEAAPPDDKAKAAIDTLRTDMHVELSSRGGRPGYWFTHPHVANLMYEVWVPSAEHGEHVAHLRDALGDAIKAVPRGWAAVPLLRRMAANLSARSDRSAPADDRSHLPAALREASDQLGVGMADLAAPVLAEWIRAERWSRRPEHSACEYAIGRLDGPPEKGTEDLVRALIELDNPGVDRELWEFVHRQPDWPGWLGVAGPLVSRARRPRDAEGLAPVIEAFLASDSAAVTLLAAALEKAPDNGALVRLAHRAVAGELPAAASLAPVVTALHVRDCRRPPGRSPLAIPVHRTLVRDWLSANPDAELRTVYQKILEAPAIPPMLRPVMDTWAESFPGERLTGTILARRLDWQSLAGERQRQMLSQHLRLCADIDPLLLDGLVAMLASDNPGWSSLFMALPPALVRDPRFDRAARSWLRRPQSSGAWHSAYEHICGAAVPPDEELRQLAERHLRACQEEFACVTVRYWMTEISSAASRQVAGRESFQWLLAHPEWGHGWAVLADQVLRVAPHAEPVVEAMLRWVRHHPDEPPAATVLVACLGTDVDAEVRGRLLRFVDDWLSGVREGWTRTYLVARRWLDPARGVALAMPRLLGDVDDRAWIQLLSANVHDLDGAQLGEVLRHWFTTSAGGRFARLVWSVAAEHPATAELLREKDLRAAATHWLAGNQHVGAWRDIGAAFITADPRDGELLEVFLAVDPAVPRIYKFAEDLAEWLSTRPDDAEAMCEVLSTMERTEAWRIVWRRVVSVVAGDRAWHTSLNVLTEEPAQDFAPLWTRLWDTYVTDEHRSRLVAIARDRLAAGTVKEETWRNVRQRLSALEEPTAAAVVAPVLPVHEPDGAEQGVAQRHRIRCPNCRKSGERLVARGVREGVFLCPECDHDLTVDFEVSEVTGVRPMARRAGRLVSVTAKAAKARVECDRCGRTWIANVPGRTGERLAVDRECGYVYVVTEAEIVDFVEFERLRRTPAD
ncbi:trypsin-like peptidase domain-containing protein [Actinoplanes sp. CA-030573]|uniref:trypsin-like peptidase domain-containing protein n=1 Tax=Actinoplanes sp. CA-030573 TaxID=3239898 RepID=UPI003D8E1600